MGIENRWEFVLDNRLDKLDATANEIMKHELKEKLNERTHEEIRRDPFLQPLSHWAFAFLGLPIRVENAEIVFPFVRPSARPVGHNATVHTHVCKFRRLARRGIHPRTEHYVAAEGRGRAWSPPSAHGTGWHRSVPLP